MLCTAGVLPGSAPSRLILVRATMTFFRLYVLMVLPALAAAMPTAPFSGYGGFGPLGLSSTRTGIKITPRTDMTFCWVVLAVV